MKDFALSVETDTNCWSIGISRLKSPSTTTRRTPLFDICLRCLSLFSITMITRAIRRRHFFSRVSIYPNRISPDYANYWTTIHSPPTKYVFMSGLKRSKPISSQISIWSLRITISQIKPIHVPSLLIPTNDSRAYFTICSSTIVNVTTNNFRRQLQICCICTDEIPGGSCIRLRRCGHFYCRSCLGSHVRFSLEKGHFGERLCCPQSQCQQALLPTEIKDVIRDSHIYERYERVTLQHGLEAMKDILWCPRYELERWGAMERTFELWLRKDVDPFRCQEAVIGGAGDDNLAMCDRCRYTFCKKCKETFHSQTMCPPRLLDRTVAVEKGERIVSTSTSRRSSCGRPSKSKRIEDSSGDETRCETAVSFDRSHCSGRRSSDPRSVDCRTNGFTEHAAMSRVQYSNREEWWLLSYALFKM